MNMAVQLEVLADQFAVCRFAPQTAIADLVPSAGFFALTRTADELSLVVSESALGTGWQAERGWCALKVLGPLDFSLVGVLAALAAPLAEAGISIFAISTYDTDYLLVKKDKLAAAVAALATAGFVIGGG
jgi:hypothetical protein